jgi:hypothetical protein
MLILPVKLIHLMKKSIFLRFSCLALLIVIFHSFAISQDMNKISLDGTWKFRRAGTTKWMDAQVPGEVHLDLLNNKVITEPFFRDNEQYQQWIGEIGWEYQKVFFIPDTLFIHRNIELVCKGLDTYANVFLNDSLIIVADNMFRAWYANIKLVLRTGVNTLRIQFPSVVDENKSRYSKLSYKLPGDESCLSIRRGLGACFFNQRNMEIHLYQILGLCQCIRGSVYTKKSYRFTCSSQG